MPNKTIKFQRSPEGLYFYKVSKLYLESADSTTKTEQCHLIDTVAENRKGYTLRQFERAKTARKLYHNIGTPTVTNFKALLRSNAIKDCPVTVEDVNIAEKIFGPDISSLKGKSTRRKPKPVTSDVIQIPKELIMQHHDIELCMDTMFVNDCGFLTAIDRTIKFRSLVPINSKQHKEYYRALDVILRHYNKAGFRITTIQCDGEYRAMMDLVNDDLNVKMNYTNAKDHVPEAERNNRTIKERIRACYHRLPYKALPRIIIRHMAMNCTHLLNLFPVKHGISDRFSPSTILGQEPLNYKKHCVIPFGAYVQANHETEQTNSNAARRLDAIYLRPNNNRQGGHQLMDLNTGQLITRSRATEIPVTNIVIDAVNAMGTKQGFKSLKFRNRHGIIFYDTDWIAGVDYEENQNDDDTEDEEDEDYTHIEHEDDNEDKDDDLDENENIDQSEIDDILHDAKYETNPTMHHLEANEEQPEEEEPEDEDENDNPQERVPETVTTRRSTRETTPVDRLQPKMSGQSYYQEEEKIKKVTFKNPISSTELEYCHNLITQIHPNPNEDVEYSVSHAMLIARVMQDLNAKITTQGASFAQQYLLQKGLKIFGEQGHAASSKEMDQLHRRNCFTPISIAEMTPTERSKAMEALMFLSQKRDNSIKGRMVYNGKPTREWLTREDSASPTAALESILLTAVIDAHEGRDVMTCDIPNAFVQTVMPEKKAGEERVIMKITGVLVDMLVQLDPELYGPYVVYENGRKVLYVQVLRAIYGMLQAALLWYKKFRNDLEEEGFKFNPYDPCVANRSRKGAQHTITFHVDDLKSSHIKPKVNDEFEKWLQMKYGDHGAVTAHRGKKHDYLGMILDYTEKGKVKIDMIKYVADMIDDFPETLNKMDTVRTPAVESLFNAGQQKKLDKNRAQSFHTTVAKGLFVSKRARPDIQPTIALLCSRVKNPNESDWTKLVRLMKYLNGTRKRVLTLSADDLRIIKWFVDAAFAVHIDFKSHTGATMTFGQGAVQSISRKQKLNTRSSTEAELVGADDASVMILWTKLFMEAQGYMIKKNILYQDNKSTILLEQNGKRSSGKRTRALNIRYFFLTDQVAKGNIEIEYCPTDEMTGDYMSKPLQGTKFEKFRDEIMG